MDGTSERQAKDGRAAGGQAASSKTNFNATDVIHTSGWKGWLLPRVGRS